MRFHGYGFTKYGLMVCLPSSATGLRTQEALSSGPQTCCAALVRQERKGLTLTLQLSVKTVAEKA